MGHLSNRHGPHPLEPVPWGRNEVTVPSASTRVTPAFAALSSPRSRGIGESWVSPEIHVVNSMVNSLVGEPNINQHQPSILRKYDWILNYWLVVSNIFLEPFHIWDVILPIDELHHFSRWAHCTTNQFIIGGPFWALVFRSRSAIKQWRARCWWCDWENPWKNQDSAVNLNHVWWGAHSWQG